MSLTLWRVPSHAGALRPGNPAVPLWLSHANGRSSENPPFALGTPRSPSGYPTRTAGLLKIRPAAVEAVCELAAPRLSKFVIGFSLSRLLPAIYGATFPMDSDRKYRQNGYMDSDRDARGPRPDGTRPQGPRPPIHITRPPPVVSTAPRRFPPM